MSDSSAATTIGELERTRSSKRRTGKRLNAKASARLEFLEDVVSGNFDTQNDDASRFARIAFLENACAGQHAQIQELKRARLESETQIAEFDAHYARQALDFDTQNKEQHRLEAKIKEQDRLLTKAATQPSQLKIAKMQHEIDGYEIRIQALHNEKRGIRAEFDIQVQCNVDLTVLALSYAEDVKQWRKDLVVTKVSHAKESRAMHRHMDNALTCFETLVSLFQAQLTAAVSCMKACTKAKLPFDTMDMGSSL